ncbi:Gfo/Idh/MocA family protein [Cyclobacterium marinum]|uniref:Oxidoreductase domain protein n=1 Tax=Cyclobacterium marinum (strain ATCC 25205 / DSM 745 / LMG 13164 / NCIMB 1802) TaxID=880070 RepID=G0IU92_CYCMS|nr:Gfo/Idh/MocA family oxidoreductase [Cyclobacterium marinum]AEL24087.1 oxidoreductase domain protein [Cyclobacterium marinum DSM 745]MBI0398793.1 Gfo/Idh/MocA family oxidoreductase [Cyclobacterium marinum]MBR9774893.1 Gfo/Idh/MocA family oxidoreductase [Cytophagales bacterium]|tara:strand:+ start:20145 stop:21491 length:1347 start_codon:yes stop_codon:yes gene_type:complete
MNNKRRTFLKKMSMAGAASAIVPAALAKADQKSMVKLKRTSEVVADQELKIALIGAGIMGSQDMNTALKHDNVSIVAVCDLYDGRLDDAKEKWGQHLFLTKDYKEILKRKDIDAVLIGTPDHWHKQISIDAMKAGKHVYCEKPMVHSVDEGKDVIDAWKKYGKIMMVGSQGISSLGNEKAKELLAEGVIGDINYAEGFWARHSPPGAWQYNVPADGTPETVDWERYISNTTERPFDPLRFFRWRNYLDYGTGMSGDLFVHLFTSLHFITNSLGPNKVSAMGGLRYWKDGREVPDVLLGMFQYPDSEQHPGFNLSLRCNFVDGTSGSTYLKIVGSKGSMDVKWDEVVVKTNKQTSSDDPFLEAQAKMRGEVSDRKKILPPNEVVYKVEPGYKGAHYDHFGNFFKAIRENGQVEENPVFAFRAAAPALLCNDSYFQDEFIKWDPVNMKLV